VAYFRNAAVNLLNLHYAITALVSNGASAFIGVYLFRAGLTLPGVLLVMAGILVLRFAVRPMVVPLAVRVGLQPLVVAGTLIIAAQFLILAEVHGANAALYALIVVSAIGDAVYWSGYHAYFAALGDPEHRGHQIGVREAAAAIAGIAAPVVTAWLLVIAGPMVAFGAASAVLVGAALPLLWTPNIPVARHSSGAIRAARFGITIFMLDGWIGAGFLFVWQLALFLSLDQSFVKYGGALALAALVGAVAGMLLGRHIDAGGGGRAVFVASTAMTIVILLRAASPGHPIFAVTANAVASIAVCLYVPTTMTAVYNCARASRCPLRFHVGAEGGWDAGAASGSLLAAALLERGVPISIALLLPLAAIGPAVVLLRRYYDAGEHAHGGATVT
jgi:DHA1 family inner membrane transport protein